MSIAEKLTTIAENVPKVYEAGKAAGGDTEAAYNEGYTDGQKDEWSRFWDNYQDYGNRKEYTYAFSKEGWNNETFKPKYPIKVIGDGSYMFDGVRLTDFDFVERGINLDTSGATSLTYCFKESKGIKRLGTISCLGCKNVNRVFYGCPATTIDTVVVYENLTYSNTFDYTNNLVNMVISGIIGQNGLNFQWAKELSHDSLMSIINALQDKSADTSGTAWKVKIGSDNIAKLTTEELNIAYTKGWEIE